MSRIYDVAVIGAGVIGAAVSYFTALDGADVILLDKGDIAEGTSSKSDGNILVCDKMPGFDSRLAKRYSNNPTKNRGISLGYRFLFDVFLKIFLCFFV